tara:strand:+ start:348 stop:542 length:195 start_codon:yes stop_codon:yes gene_type:complete
LTSKVLAQDLALGSHLSWNKTSLLEQLVSVKLAKDSAFLRGRLTVVAYKWMTRNSMLYGKQRAA